MYNIGQVIPESKLIFPFKRGTTQAVDNPTIYVEQTLTRNKLTTMPGIIVAYAFDEDHSEGSYFNDAHEVQVRVLANDMYEVVKIDQLTVSIPKRNIDRADCVANGCKVDENIYVQTMLRTNDLTKATEIITDKIKSVLEAKRIKLQDQVDNITRILSEY